MSIYKGNTLLAGGSQITPLLSFIWADHLINNISWLRSDTFSWQDGTVYSAVYTHLSSDISGKSLQSETISGTTIQYYLADDGHKICPASEESNVSAIYTATGVAWYYIIDTANTRFKLPRTQWGFTGNRNGVGGYVGESLPNIKGSTATSTSDYTNTGAFQNGSTLYNFGPDNRNYGYKPTLTYFDASRSSSTYQDNAPVQERATQMYLYFYVGQFTQSAISQTAGLNAELFNGKVDTGHQVIEFQAPTASNNYTWYRKYADGWVEQGGQITGTSYNSWTNANLVVGMSTYSGNINIQSGGSSGVYYNSGQFGIVDSTHFKWTVACGEQVTITWRAEGIVA